MKNKIEHLILFLGNWSLHPNCQEFKVLFCFVLVLPPLLYLPIPRIIFLIQSMDQRILKCLNISLMQKGLSSILEKNRN